jgi:hypothetical protein
MLRKPKEMTFIDIQGSLVSLSRQFILMSVFAPTGELLSFASPKESSQRKGDPDSANFLRFSLLARVFEGPSLALRKRAASLPLPLRAYFTKSCDARGGITGEKSLCVTRVNNLHHKRWP